jgi:3-oxoadipyl-CoA thiolase
MHRVVIVSAVRTPMGRYGGALKEVRPDDLAALAIGEAVRRAGVDPAGVDEVILGCANQAGEDNRNVARMSLLLAGLPVTVAGVTVNRLCASGMEAVAQAYRLLALGEAECCVAGGVESMTRAPFVLAKPDRAFPRGEARLWDTALGWRLVNPRLVQLYPPLSMGETAENVAQRYRVSRARQDAYALESHRRAVRAQEEGHLAAHMVAVPLSSGEVVARDEGPRPDTSLEKLSRLPPVFRSQGTVTAGNSSPLSDGAAALVLMTEERARAEGRTPLARVVGSASVGVDPSYMGVGPIPATRRLLARLGWKVQDLVRVELNEAFAAQVLPCMEELGLDSERTNVWGGAIALGHPLGASGARLVGTLVHALRQAGGGRGLATLCVGVGQGQALAVETP